MGGLASLPDEAADAFGAVAKLLEQLAKGLEKIVDYFPDLVKGIIDLFENLVGLLGYMAKGARVAVIMAPAILILYVVTLIIEELDL